MKNSVRSIVYSRAQTVCVGLILVAFPATLKAATCSANCDAGYSYQSGTCTFTEDQNDTIDCNGSIVCVSDSGKGTKSSSCKAAKGVGSTQGASQTGYTDKEYCRPVCKGDDYEYESGECKESLISGDKSVKCTERTKIVCSKIETTGGGQSTQDVYLDPCIEDLIPDVESSDDSSGGGSSTKKTKRGDCKW